MSGRATIQINHEHLFFQQGVSAIIFDTSDCEGCKESYPSYRVMGDLILDSIVVDDTTYPITSQSQLSGTYINSDSLLTIFKQLNIYALVRTCKRCIPNDTVKWDTIRGKWQYLPDLSKYFDVFFDSNMIIGTALEQLRSAPEILHVDYVPYIREDALPSE